MDYEPENLNECSLIDSVPIVKVRSKIFDLNRSVMMPYQQSMICSNHQCNNNLTLSSSSGCSSQSSSSSAGSAFCCSNKRSNHQLAVSIPSNVTSRYDPFRCSLTSSSSLSSTASFSSQSTFGSNPLPHSRCSLKEASRNFRDFIHCYEQSLLTCLSNVEPGYDGLAGKEKYLSSNDACVMKRDARQQQQQQLVIKPLEKYELQKKRSKNAPMNDNCHQTFNKNIDVTSNDACGMGDECGDGGGLHCRVCDVNEENCCCVERVNALTKKKEQVFEQIETESSDHNNHHVSELAVDIREPTLKSISKNENELVQSLAPKDSHTSLSKLSLIFENKLECTSSTSCHHHINVNRKNPTDNKSDSFRQSLRLQLEKVRELREQYDRGYRCKEAIEKLEKLTNKSRDCDREWRANEQMLTSIQHKLESLIGTFQIRVDEIEGWARICPRDTYEIEFRHGKQRQVLRVKIGKASERIWDSGRREVSFRGSPKPVIVCRVREVKSGWRNLAVWSKRFVEIGVTSISMSELLESVSKNCPILLDANPSGSLKLRIFCQWQPNVDSLLPSSTGAEISLQKCPYSDEKNVSIPAHLKDGYPLWQNQHDRFSTSSIREKHPMFDDFPNSKIKFGLNKDLARSLLTLPTYMDFDGDPVAVHQRSSYLTSSLSSNKTAACTDQFPGGQDVTTLPTSQRQVATIQQMLSMLKTSLEDYGGHAVEITLMSQSVNRLIHIYQKFSNEFPSSISKATSNDSLKTADQKIYSSQKDDQTSAFIEEAFEFLNDQYNNDDASSDTDDDDDDDGDGEAKIIASFDSHEFEQNGNENLPVDLLKSAKNGPNYHFEICQMPEVKSPSSHAERRSFFIKNLSKWNSILSIHLSSAIEQLDHIGSWILKSREQRALCRLQADTFAMEQIFVILSKIWNTAKCDQRQIDENEAIGVDPRVIELWNFFRHHMAPSELNRLIYSHYQISSLIAKLIMDYNLIGNIPQPDDDSDDILNRSSDWFTSCFITNIGSEAMLTTEHSGLITIFNIRAFFELALYEHSIKNPCTNVRKPAMKLRSFLEIAIDLNRLLRMKTRKIAMYRIEQILFKSFNINCYWIPVDLSLIVINLLYEHHCNQEMNKSRSAIRGQRSHTTNEVKKSDRLRELSKILTNWLAWLLEEARLEIHQHVLSGLESPCPLTRRASCYGLMYLFRLMKRVEEKKHHCDGLYKTNDSISNTIQTFYGQEMDSLLYLSLEDPDVKVREEARKALKCLGSFSTNFKNFSRKQTPLYGSSSSLHLNYVVSDAKKVRPFSTGPIHQHNGGELIGINKINAYHHHHTGTSMPNLNLNGEWMVDANPNV